MSPNSPDAPDNQKNIANVVGKHADRVMDGLFSEIEEMLSGDLQEKSPPAGGNLSAAAPVAARRATPPIATPGPIYQQPQQPPAAPQPVPAAPVKTGGGLWKKLLAGTGILVLLGGGSIWWLQKEGKINLAALNSLGSGNNSDAQFSDYLQRSVTKIEGSTAPTVPSPAELAIPNPPADSSAIPTAPAPAAISTSFLKIVAGTPPLAEFLIDGKTQQLKSGDPIGTSGWNVGSVPSTADNEVIVKRNGEIRSLKTGDKL